MGTLQKNYQEYLWELLLHLSSKESFWLEPTYRPLMGKSLPGGILEIRFAGTTSPVFRLQHSQGRNGSGLLQKNVKRNRPKRNGKATKRQTSNSKSLRPLPKVIRGLPTDKGIVHKIK